jgi:hypothetical protein
LAVKVTKQTISDMYGGWTSTVYRSFVITSLFFNRMRQCIFMLKQDLLHFSLWCDKQDLVISNAA